MKTALLAKKPQTQCHPLHETRHAHRGTNAVLYSELLMNPVADCTKNREVIQSLIQRKTEAHGAPCKQPSLSRGENEMVPGFATRPRVAAG